jgi:hypothetical protein
MNAKSDAVTGRHRRRWGALLALALTTAAPGTRAETQLHDIPFWKTMAGWWRAENTYFDGKLDYNLRSYSSLVHIELDGRRVRETEYKFYPAGKLAQQAGRGRLAVGDGIETVTVFEGELVNDRGEVRFRSDPATRIDVLGVDTAVRVTANAATGVDTYRMYIFAPTPDKRYRSNFGIVSDTQGAGAANALPGAQPGDLRGFSLFREDRIAADEFAVWRSRFRERHGVRAVAEQGDDGALKVTPLP